MGLQWSDRELIVLGVMAYKQNFSHQDIADQVNYLRGWQQRPASDKVSVSSVTSRLSRKRGENRDWKVQHVRQLQEQRNFGIAEMCRELDGVDEEELGRRPQS